VSVTLSSELAEFSVSEYTPAAFVLAAALDPEFGAVTLAPVSGLPLAASVTRP
jgi:hypothetical protein